LEQSLDFVRVNVAISINIKLSEYFSDDIKSATIIGDSGMILKIGTSLWEFLLAAVEQTRMAHLILWGTGTSLREL